MTGTLHAAVLQMVRTGSPVVAELAGWLPYAPGTRCTALFQDAGRVAADPAAVRRRAWAAVR